MVKVQILTQCEYCEGEAYLPVGEAVSNTGETYQRFQPCTVCKGSGKQTRWVDLREFAELLDRALSLEPDWQELAQQPFATQYADSCDAAGI
jgi:hypothetical protein